MNIAKLISRLDLSEITAQLDTIAAERERDQEARQRGESEFADVNAKLGVIARERRGLDVADALRDGVDVLDASESEDILKERRVALGMGLQQLDRDETARNAREQALRSQARGIVGKAVAPVVDQVQADARAAAQTLLNLYVRAKALADAVPSYGVEALVSQLREATVGLAAEKLLPSFGSSDGPTLEVDESTVRELNTLAPFLPALRGRVPTKVPPPVSFKVFRA